MTSKELKTLEADWKTPKQLAAARGGKIATYQEAIEQLYLRLSEWYSDPDASAEQRALADKKQEYVDLRRLSGSGKKSKENSGARMCVSPAGIELLERFGLVPANKKWKIAYHLKSALHKSSPKIDEEMKALRLKFVQEVSEQLGVTVEEAEALVEHNLAGKREIHKLSLLAFSEDAQRSLTPATRALDNKWKQVTYLAKKLHKSVPVVGEEMQALRQQFIDEISGQLGITAGEAEALVEHNLAGNRRVSNHVSLAFSEDAQRSLTPATRALDNKWKQGSHLARKLLHKGVRTIGNEMQALRQQFIDEISGQLGITAGEAEALVEHNLAGNRRVSNHVSLAFSEDAQRSLTPPDLPLKKGWKTIEGLKQLHGGHTNTHKKAIHALREELIKDILKKNPTFDRQLAEAEVKKDIDTYKYHGFCTWALSPRAQKLLKRPALLKEDELTPEGLQKAFGGNPMRWSADLLQLRQDLLRDISALPGVNAKEAEQYVDIVVGKRKGKSGPATIAGSPDAIRIICDPESGWQGRSKKWKKEPNQNWTDAEEKKRGKESDSALSV